MKNKVKTIVILKVLATITIHVINRVQYSVATSKNILPHNENNYYEWRFGKVRYTKKGIGNPVLLLHDLSVGSSSYEFSKITESLSKNHEVYCLDFLGYGLSDKSNMTYTNYLYVQLLNDFIKNIIGRKTDIIATGDAAPVAVMACHNDPETMNKLIFINPQNLYQLNQIPSKQTKTMKFFMELPIFGTFIYNLFTTKESFQKTFASKYFYNPSLIEEKDILSYVESSHLTDYKSKYAFTSYMGRYMNSNILHALKEINHSISIIGGEEKEENKTIIDNYIYYNSSIEATMIPKTKQLPHLEAPEQVLKTLEVYLV